MNDRIQKLCAFLDKCDSFADVGCDHGYCTLYMLKNGLCNSATVSDISEKCLKKAEKLLERYIISGKCKSVCRDGLGKEKYSQVLIAGMGGEEITAILKRDGIPERFVLQPMRNARTLREFLVGSGAKITRDAAFESGKKFYLVIKGESTGGGEKYSEAELEYGKQTSAPELQAYLYSELKKKKEYLKGLPYGSESKLFREAELLIGVLNGGN